MVILQTSSHALVPRCYDDQLAFDDNAWSGPPASSGSVTSRSSLGIRCSSSTPQSSVRKVKRKPAPLLTPEILTDLANLKASTPALPDGSQALHGRRLSVDQLRSADPSVELLPNSVFVLEKTTIGRKTSVSGHIKNALRRRATVARESPAMSISAPVDVVHVAGATPSSALPPQMRRPSVSGSSSSSVRSSVASTDSGELQFRLSPLPEHESLPNVDMLATNLMKPQETVRQPLRPTKSIRRPGRSLDQPEPLSSVVADTGRSTLRERRKAIYAPADLGILSRAIAFKSPAVLDDTAKRQVYHKTHARASSFASIADTEPDLSRSPSSILSSSCDSDDNVSCTRDSETSFRHAVVPTLSQNLFKHCVTSVWNTSQCSAYS